MTASDDDRYSIRDRVICNRVSRAVLTDPDRAEQIMFDARTHSELDRLKSMLLMADKAMQVEGIATDVRDRVLHWLLFGAPPPVADPEEAIDAHVRRHLDEKLQLQAMTDYPPNVLGDFLDIQRAEHERPRREGPGHAAGRRT